MALHEQPAKTDEWYTPKYVFDAMRVHFDVDVASPGSDIVPWIPANYHVTADSLSYSWRAAFVWMNAPFGGRNGLVPWLSKFFGGEIDSGVALVPDRTSAPWWQRYAARAERILFVTPKIKFIGANGNAGSSPAQGTTLFSIGRRGNEALENAAVNGLGLLLRPEGQNLS